MLLFFSDSLLISTFCLGLKHLQVQSDYDQLRQTFTAVSRERDTAQQQKSRLQVKVDNLEHVLKVRKSIYIFIQVLL